jgi:hypothetical protein
MERAVLSMILDAANMVVVFKSVVTVAAVKFAREDEKKEGKEKQDKSRG